MAVRIVCCTLALLMMALLLVGPYVYYRREFEKTRRLRVVSPGVLYRSGRMTSAGLEEAIRDLKIKTVVNLWDSRPDPLLDNGQRESQLCQEHGIRHIFLPVDLIDPRLKVKIRPATIDKFLAIMDDPANHPVLIHCRAGVHRTGVHAAVYRMEYEGWSIPRAMDELKQTGFGDSVCNGRNLYVSQYVLQYQPRQSVQCSVVGGQKLATDHRSLTTDH